MRGNLFAPAPPRTGRQGQGLAFRSRSWHNDVTGHTLDDVDGDRIGQSSAVPPGPLAAGVPLLVQFTREGWAVVF